MKKLKMFALLIAVLMSSSSAANAEPFILAPDDFVGISFWVVSMVCLAATAFFFIERNSVPAGWKVSITVAGLVTGIAFIHYMYMREIWVMTGDMPVVYRYIDWLITGPLLILEFYFVLSAVKKVNFGIFWRLLIGSVVMLSGRYLGEAGHINPILGFVIGMAGWIYVLYEVFSGEAGKMAAKSGNKPFANAFSSMRMIVTVGWAIYPLGYVYAYLTGGADANLLNMIYNATDFLNKIVFGLIIWAAAIKSSGKTT